MEELLNKLIEKGWKPFWIRWEETRIKIERNEDLDMKIFKLDWIIIEQHHRISWSLRNLTSKESWLWQFVCENGMIKTYMNIEHESRRHSDKNHKPVWAFDNQSYYYLIESALCNEEDLEQFLLDNIKV